MPDLIKLYIRSGVFGLALAGGFVGVLMGFDVMNLRSLVMNSDVGLVALMALWLSNGIVFGGVQFAISVMSLEDGGAPRGGLPMRQLQPIRVTAQAPRGRHNQRARR